MEFWQSLEGCVGPGHTEGKRSRSQVGSKVEAKARGWQGTHGEQLVGSRVCVIQSNDYHFTLLNISFSWTQQIFTLVRCVLGTGLGRWDIAKSKPNTNLCFLGDHILFYDHQSVYHYFYLAYLCTYLFSDSPTLPKICAPWSGGCREQF